MRINSFPAIILRPHFGSHGPDRPAGGQPTSGGEVTAPHGPAGPQAPSAGSTANDVLEPADVIDAPAPTEPGSVDGVRGDRDDRREELMLQMITHFKDGLDETLLRMTESGRFTDEQLAEMERIVNRTHRNVDFLAQLVEYDAGTSFKSIGSYLAQNQDIVDEEIAKMVYADFIETRPTEFGYEVEELGRGRRGGNGGSGGPGNPSGPGGGPAGHGGGPHTRLIDTLA